jgi:hypothetical protein
MQDPRYEKEYGVTDLARDQVGIYGTGFERESLLGFLLPWIVVGAIGIPLGLIIWKVL